MSLIPDLEIGFWNAWILMLYYPLHPLIMIVVDKAVGTGEMMQKMGDVPYEKGERRIFIVSLVLMLLQFAYSIFLPLRISTVWFYAGLTIYLVGLIMFITAIVNIAVAPLGQPFTEGMYRFSRHPLMFSSSITFVGTGIASASWIFLLVSVVIIILQTSQAVAEERGCLETYGEEYREYLNRTPRWIGMPNSNPE
jgi:protein-S-isoprenylcysteine O-methyltransferase Ste14